MSGEKLIKYAKKISSFQGVFEDTKTSLWQDKSDIQLVMEDNIAKTCLHIIVSLVNQDMQIVSEDKEAQKVLKQYNKQVKIKRKMDSIVFNQIGWGNSVFFYDVVRPKLMVYDSSTFDIVSDSKKDEFLGIYQRTNYVDPEAQKEGMNTSQMVEEYIDEENLILVPGIGSGYGESVLKAAQPYVEAKRDLVNSFVALVKRLGLLTVIGVDLPGELGDDDVDEYLDLVGETVRKASANSIWILPLGTEVSGVKSSGESRVIEAVKTLVELLDEEIRKCLFIPDTFLSSLSANRATAKEQRYLIASMVSHIRDLVEESLIDMYDALLLHHGIEAEYYFTWGNINLPEPEKLFDFIIKLLEMKGMDYDEVRSYINLGVLPDNLRKEIEDDKKRATQGDIYRQMSGGVKDE